MELSRKLFFKNFFVHKNIDKTVNSQENDNEIIIF